MTWAICLVVPPLVPGPPHNGVQGRNGPCRPGPLAPSKEPSLGGGSAHHSTTESGERRAEPPGAAPTPGSTDQTGERRTPARARSANRPPQTPDAHRSYSHESALNSLQKWYVQMPVTQPGQRKNLTVRLTNREMSVASVMLIWILAACGLSQRLTVAWPTRT